MKYEFLYQPNDEDRSRMAAFYNTQKWVTLEQHPEWTTSIEPWKKLCFFIATADNKLVCSAVIEETKSKFISYANIQFGPLFSDPEIAAACIHQIYVYYKNAGYELVTIQPGLPTGATADHLELFVNKLLPVKYSFDRSNWSSISINLALAEDELLRNMSKGHKSDIKKAIKSGLNAIEEFSDAQFEEFISIYIKMHKERGLPESPIGSSSFLHALRKNFSLYGTGKFLLVVTQEQKVLGGIALLYQGSVVRYFKGAADPETRNLPVLHLAIWTAMTESAAKGFEQFDLWGYNHYVDESDQIFFINRFKKGFGGEFTFYPKKMYLILKPVRYAALKNIKRIYKKIFKS